MVTRPVTAGRVAWVDFGTTQGRVQSGRRPAVIVSSVDFLETIDAYLLVIPCTSRDRGWPNHVPVTGALNLDRPTFAMTEQIHTIARTQVVGDIGVINDACLEQISTWLDDWLI